MTLITQITDFLEPDDTSIDTMKKCIEGHPAPDGTWRKCERKTSDTGKQALFYSNGGLRARHHNGVKTLVWQSNP